jgi:hypothetical protein
VSSKVIMIAHDRIPWTKGRQCRIETTVQIFLKRIGGTRRTIVVKVIFQRDNKVGLTLSANMFTWVATLTPSYTECRLGFVGRHVAPQSPKKEKSTASADRSCSSSEFRSSIFLRWGRRGRREANACHSQHQPRRLSLSCCLPLTGVMLWSSRKNEASTREILAESIKSLLLKYLCPLILDAKRSLCT